MIARVAGGAAAGWLLSLAPLIVVNTLSLSGGVFDPSATALAGAIALGLGVALGGIAAGLIGGRRGGAIAGVIAGALFAACLIALMYTLRAQGNLPNLVAQHPVRTMGALVFIGALMAGVALGVSVLAGRKTTLAPGLRAQHPDQRNSGPRPRDVSWSEPATRRPYGMSQPRPDARELTPSQRGVKPDPRRAPPASGARQAPPQPARRPAPTRGDERGYNPDGRGGW